MHSHMNKTKFIKFDLSIYHKISQLSHLITNSVV